MKTKVYELADGRTVRLTYKNISAVRQAFAYGKIEAPPAPSPLPGCAEHCLGGAADSDDPEHAPDCPQYRTGAAHVLAGGAR